MAYKITEWRAALSSVAGDLKHRIESNEDGTEEFTEYNESHWELEQLEALDTFLKSIYENLKE